MRHTVALAALTLAPALLAQDTVWRNATTTNLPVAATHGRSMDAEVADVNGDGRPDIVLASEFATNLVMLAGTRGTFTYPTGLFPQARIADSEDIAVADFNGDGRPDLAFACEDDMTPELYLQNADGTFQEASDRLPVKTVGNAILAIDIDGDGDLDIILGDAGQSTMPQAPASGAPNVLLINDGDGTFTEDTTGILPQTDGATQDIEAGDVDGDGDIDIVIANENGNELWINEGGRYVDKSSGHLPPPASPIETREIDLADIDGDGDLYLFAANVGWRGLNARNTLYRNDGNGRFTDITDEHLPFSLEWTLDVEFADLDADGDLDMVLGQHDQGGQAKPVRVLLNDGAGDFTDATDDWVPPMALIHTIDVEIADFDNDGKPDLYVANHVSADRLLLSSKG